MLIDQNPRRKSDLKMHISNDMQATFTKTKTRTKVALAVAGVALLAVAASAFNSRYQVSVRRIPREFRLAQTCQNTNTPCDDRQGGYTYPCDIADASYRTETTPSENRAICTCQEDCSGVQARSVNPSAPATQSFRCKPCSPGGSYGICCTITFP